MIQSDLVGLDGVLADSGDAHYLAWERMFQELGRAITRQEFDDTFGMANTAILERWMGPTLRRAQRCACSPQEVLFREYIDCVRLLPGVLDWLEYARSLGYYLVVASSGEMANVVAVVHALGLGNYFHGLVSGAFLPQSKPHPAVFLQAAAAVAAEPRHCLVLEDGIVGIEAARRAGMRCIGLTTTHVADRLAGADRIVATLADLPPATMDAYLD